ncbi:MAG: acyl phosphate:glycerol-3-phosphate acyltransferase [Thermosediminibacterales bacterium]|nr:acyl phosphate:glycerol-3-phosphate acyltransferase [Thermosediminibacterales bacterium]
MLQVLTVIASYLLGSISFSYIIVKLWMNIDIRNYGSGNAGATNVLRVLGKKAAAAVLFLDMLKGFIAVVIGNQIGGENISLICGIAVVLGHNWPVFFKFKGGKGIATSIGVVLAISPLIMLYLILIAVVIIYFTRYVSLASITGALIYPLLVLLFKMPKEYIIFSLILSILAVIRHHSNIYKLLTGKESKIGEKIHPKVE